MSEINPDKIKFIEQYLIVYMSSRSIYEGSDCSPEQQRCWAKEGLKEAYSAWNAIQPLRINTYNL